MGLHVCINRLTGYKQTNNIVEVAEYKNSFSELKRLLIEGKKITVSCSYKKHASDIQDIIGREQPQKRVLLIDSDGAYDTCSATNGKREKMQRKAKISGDTTDWGNYDLVIWTPTMCG